MPQIGATSEGGGEKRAGFSSLPEVANTTPSSSDLQQQARHGLLSPSGPNQSSGPVTSPAGFRPATTNRPKPLETWSPAPYENLSPALAVGTPGRDQSTPHGHLPPPPYLPSEPPSPAYSSASYAPLNPPLQPGSAGLQPPQSPYFSPYSANHAVHSTEWVPMARPPGVIGLDPAAEARAKRRKRVRLLTFCCVPLVLLLVAFILGLVFGVIRTNNRNTPY